MILHCECWGCRQASEAEAGSVAEASQPRTPTQLPPVMFVVSSGSLLSPLLMLTH